MPKLIKLKHLLAYAFRGELIAYAGICLSLLRRCEASIVLKHLFAYAKRIYYLSSYALARSAYNS